MPIDPTLAAKGMATGAAMPNRASGIGDTIRAITNDLRSAKQNRDKEIQDKKTSNSGVITALLKAGYRPTDIDSFNKVLDSGELPGFTKGGADNLLGQPPAGMKVKGASVNPEGETSYTYEPAGTRGSDVLNRATILRKEFNTSQITKDYQTISRAYKGIDDAYKLSTSGDRQSRIASDQALGVMFQKLLDPQSVVRESEYARTPEGASLLNRLQSIAPQMAQGGLVLKDTDRKALVIMSKKLLDSAQGAFNSQIERYTQLANDYEVDPKLIMGNIKPIGAADMLSNPNLEQWIPMIKPDGTATEVRLDSVQEALASGYRRK